MMYVILDRAPDRNVSVLRSVASGDAIAAKLTEPALRQKWQAVREAVTKDPYTNGEINSYAIYDMENRATELAFEINKNIGVGVTARQKTLHELVGIMQAMMAIYLRNNADPRGGSGYVGINKDVDPAILQDKFGKKIQELIKSDQKMASALGKTKAKWRFLSSRFTDYNSQAVPFVVDLYGNQIIDELLVLAGVPH